jgi:DNA-binding transcriptional MerR regulator
MSTEVAGTPPPRKEKALTIGAVVKQLEREFPDISISKVRYLEDQKLLSPRRTPGGYRLYGPADVDRLRTILRLQRDEFLPLRVIRQELAAGLTEAETPPVPEARGPRWRCAARVRCTGSTTCWRTPAPTSRSSRSWRTTE